MVAALLIYTVKLLPFDGLLDKSHVPAFVKRLRSRGYSVRYYGCGEYGEHTHRPHYHLIMYGLEPRLVEPRHDCRKDWLCKLWGLGHVDSGSVTKDSIQYVAGYTFKHYDDYKRGWCFRVPPYSIMSRMPGIGKERFLQLCDSVEMRLDLPNRPRTIRIGGRFWPLDSLLTVAYGETVFHGERLQSPDLPIVYNNDAAVQRLASWSSRRKLRVL